MTHRGVSLKYLAKNIRVENYAEQINCILKNLKSLNLNQNDILSKNICVNRKGHLSLIDFDMAKINNLSDKDYLKEKRKLTKVIKKNKHLILN